MTECQIWEDRRTVVDVHRAAANDTGSVEAFVEPATSEQSRKALTFGAWDRAADGVAGWFASLGVGPGTVVNLVLPSSIDYMVCYAAATRLGAVTSGINPRLGPAEARSIVERTRPVVTVVDDGLDPPGGPTGTVVFRSDVQGAFAGRPPPSWPVIRPEDPVAVVWTSGTTGLPKGAVFDHRNLAAVADGTDALSADGDRRLSPLPFAHVGTMTRTWDEAVHGVTTVITPTPWRAAEMVSILEVERITVAQGVPTQWSMVLAHPALDEADLSALRVIGTGGSRVPEELVVALRSQFGVPVIVRYTSTEASLGTGTRVGDPDLVVATTVGRPVAGVELQVVDEALGRALDPGEVGRVRIRSRAVMRGYWGGPLAGSGCEGVVFDREATGEVLDADGWLTTGDLGWLATDGCLRLVGRVNELYIRGGYNVYPAEVEAALNGRPPVRQIAVVAAPDPMLGEVGVAFVVLDREPGAEPEATEPEAVRDRLRAMLAPVLADYKAPDWVVLVDELPLTPMMKIDKLVLAERAAHAVLGRGGNSAARPVPGRPTEARAR